MTKKCLRSFRILCAVVPLCASIILSACGGGGGGSTSTGSPPPPPAPAIAVTPSSLTFPSEPVGTTATLVLTVTNTGTATLTINQATLTPSEFQLQSGLNFPLSIAPGFSSTWNVSFAPDKAQPFSGTLAIASNASTSPTNLSVTGTGITTAPAIMVSPQSLAFANQVVGTSGAQTVTVTNNGNATLTISQATATPAEFQVQPSLTSPLTLAPGMSANFTIIFAPDKAQTFNGTFVITSNVPTSPTNISLTGTGVTSGALAINASPISIDFGQQVANTSSPPVAVTVTNIGTNSVTVTQASVTVTGPFAVANFSDFTLSPAQQMPLSVIFTPTSATTNLTGVLTISISDATGSAFATVSLAGAGVSTAGQFTVTPASLVFGNQTVGSSSPTTMITLTNTGLGALLLVGVGVSGPFPGSAFSGPPMTLNAGNAVQFPVAFTPPPTATGSLTGELGLFFSNNMQFVSLFGTGAAAASLAVTTASPLPAATQNAPYLALLQGSGGVQPYNWAAAPGSSLPPGLTLSPGGILSGSANTASTGDFPFVVQVTDSNSPPNIAAASLTLTVNTPPTDTSKSPPLVANCAQISSGAPAFVPLTDLGTGTYPPGGGGQVGGLYGDANNPGSNTDPDPHHSAGVTLAGSIQPLDANGNPDPNGKYVLVSIGMSNAFEEFNQFVYDAQSDPSLNPHLVIVNGAQAGFGADAVADPNNVYWTNLINTILPAAGVTSDQVVAAWVKEALPGPDPTESFTTYTGQLQPDLEAIARNLHTKFPNIKLAYYAARTYGGYANGVSAENPEPFAYWAGFADRGAILDQINNPCSTNLNFDSKNCGGTVSAPWIAWGPYFWANGMTPRSDGALSTCQDYEGDGTHPSDTGRQKVGTMLLDFFTTDPTTTPWFLAH